MKPIYFINHHNLETNEFISTAIWNTMSASEALEAWEHHWEMVYKHKLQLQK